MTWASGFLKGLQIILMYSKFREMRTDLSDQVRLSKRCFSILSKMVTYRTQRDDLTGYCEGNRPRETRVNVDFVTVYWDNLGIDGY